MFPVHTWQILENDLAQGLNAHTSNKASSNLPPQIPLAETLRRPSSPLIDVLKAKNSPDNRSRWCSTSTFEQTSVKISAVLSLTSLCRIAVKPLVGQDKQCSTENVSPQTQWERTSFSGQLYRTHNAPRNAALLMQKPCLLTATLLVWRASFVSQFNCSKAVQHLFLFRRAARSPSVFQEMLVSAYLQLRLNQYRLTKIYKQEIYSLSESLNFWAASDLEWWCSNHPVLPETLVQIFNVSWWYTTRQFWQKQRSDFAFEFGEINFNFILATVNPSHHVISFRKETMRKHCKSTVWLRFSVVR